MADLNTLLQMAQAAGLGSAAGGAAPIGPPITNQNPMAAAIASQMNQPGYSPLASRAPGQAIMGGWMGAQGSPNQMPPMNYGDNRPQTYDPEVARDLDAEGRAQDAADNSRYFDMRSGQQGMGAYLNDRQNRNGKDNSYIDPKYGPYQDEWENGPGSGDRVNRANKGNKLTDEEELDDISNRMGGVTGRPTKSGDPSADGNFPTTAEIRKILDEPTDMNLEMFDQKWGDGAAAEILGAQPGAPKGKPTTRFPSTADMYEGDDR